MQIYCSQRIPQISNPRKVCVQWQLLEKCRTLHHKCFYNLANSDGLTRDGSHCTGYSILLGTFTVMSSPKGTPISHCPILSRYLTPKVKNHCHRCIHTHLVNTPEVYKVWEIIKILIHIFESPTQWTWVWVNSRR